MVLLSQAKTPRWKKTAPGNARKAGILVIKYLLGNDFRWVRNMKGQFLPSAFFTLPLGGFRSSSPYHALNMDPLTSRVNIGTVSMNNLF